MPYTLQIFFFQCYIDPRDLHSFPTRRSSDLFWGCCGSERPGPLVSGDCWRERSPLLRSEEHTSELQSRGHLVCRLLLEKKKKPRGARDVDGPPYRAGNSSRPERRTSRGHPLF